MEQPAENPAIKRLAAFIGEWSMEAELPGASPGDIGARTGAWKLWRESEDFSPLDFSQRFTGTFSDDGTTISGRWENSGDGSTWEHDFKLTYTKVA